ncbi:MAG: phage holin family protein [Luteolibacter sp.]|jgi:uncharacterized membrane protein YqjE
MPQEIHAQDPQRPSGSAHDSAAVPSWADHVFDLIASRIALFQLEAKQAASRNAGRAIMMAVAAFFVVITWLLLLAATAGIVHVLAGFAWYWTCLIFAAIHLLTAAALLRAARAPGTPAFEYTVAEFHKDRAWLRDLQHPKSKR